MRFLIDECTGPEVAKWLKSQKYEVFSIYNEARGIDDEEILGKAFNENWILITNDKDFGEKVFRENYPHRGVILLRLNDETHTNKINVIGKLLREFRDRLIDNFIVVTDKHVRISQR